MPSNVRPQRLAVCLTAFPCVIKAESSREQSLPRVGQLVELSKLSEGDSDWTKKKKKKKHNPAIPLGFTVVHSHYHFERDCKLITNILYSY